MKKRFAGVLLVLTLVFTGGMATRAHSTHLHTCHSQAAHAYQLDSTYYRHAISNTYEPNPQSPGFQWKTVHNIHQTKTWQPEAGNYQWLVHSHTDTTCSVGIT